MIIIPTSELIGLISDVIGFAPAHKDASHHGVLIEWDGDYLTASAYDVLSGGESRWEPGNGEEGEYEHPERAKGPDPTLGVDWGDYTESTSRFRVFVYLPDAKEIVKVFKLASKFRMTPISVDINATGTQLFIERKRQHWCTAHVMRIDVAGVDAPATFPHIRQLVTGVLADNEASNTGGPLRYSASRLAQFGAVRAYDVMRMTYLGERIMTPVSIGDGFCGFIQPATVSTRDAEQAIKSTEKAGRLDLQYGSGVHVSAPAISEVTYEEVGGEEAASHEQPTLLDQVTH